METVAVGAIDNSEELDYCGEAYIYNAEGTPVAKLKRLCLNT